jgi:hypothetical protein
LLVTGFLLLWLLRREARKNGSQRVTGRAEPAGIRSGP